MMHLLLKLNTNFILANKPNGKHKFISFKILVYSINFNTIFFNDSKIIFRNIEINFLCI